MIRFLLILLLVLPLSLCAQELLMNGSFEEENICIEYEKNCAPEGWISTSLWGDYYFDDPPHALHGTHFVGLILAPADKPLARNFLRTRLLCGLRKGAAYQLEFYIRSAHEVFDSIGVYFSANDFLYQKEKIRSAKPQLYLKEARGLKPTNEWQKVRLTYIASGEENYISLGDFKMKGYKWGSRRADLGKDFYFFIDSVSLKPKNPSEHLCAQADSIKKEEYAFDVRHSYLDRLIYKYTKEPPPIINLPKTTVQRVDTLVIPDVFFATNSYALSAQANKVLDSFIKKAASLKIDSLVVEGHTDSQGSPPSNKKLSINRASSVASYLKPHFQTAFYTRGWASEKPVADNITATGRQKNRRVEIYIYVRD